jgi:valyl-tRNA synthetase
LEGETPIGVPRRDHLDLPSRWILSRLNSLIQTVDRLFENYQYGEAGRQILSFVWDEMADWYVEVSKHSLYGDDTESKSRTHAVLCYVLDTSLRLLHPYMPFITEEIWQAIPHEGEALIVAEWPQVHEELIDAESENAMQVLMELVVGIRNTRNEYNVEPAKRVAAIVAPGNLGEVFENYAYVFGRLCNVHEVNILANGGTPPDDAATIVAADVTLYLPLSGMVDLDAERQRLEQELEDIDRQIQRIEGLMANDNFVQKAKPEVVQRERDRLEDLVASRVAVTERLAALKR